MYKSKENLESSAIVNEHDKGLNKESDEHDYEDQPEEQEEESGETTADQVF